MQQLHGLTYNEMMQLYDKANLMAIATMDRHVFAALAQIPQLVKRCQEYESKISDLQKELDNKQQNP